MLKRFYPDLIVDKVQDIDLNTLLKKGIKGVILDIDNTLVPPHVKEADDNAVRWIEKVKGAGLSVCIVSNATKKRVVKFNKKLELYAIHRAFKPAMSAFRKAMGIMGVKPDETAVIGDQIFTDIYGGNRVKAYTIMVKPIHRAEGLFVRIKRFPERIILSLYHKDSINKKNSLRAQKSH